MMGTSGHIDKVVHQLSQKVEKKFGEMAVTTDGEIPCELLKCHGAAWVSTACEWFGISIGIIKTHLIECRLGIYWRTQPFFST